MRRRSLVVLGVAGGRKHSHRVLVTSEEGVWLAALAESQGVTVPRLLVESAPAKP